MLRYAHILIACDLTPVGKATVKKGIALAKGCKAEVSLVHVVEPMPGYASGYLGVVDLERELFEEAKKGLQELGDAFHIPADHLHIEVGSPKLIILKVAEALKVNLIVLGSHGRHGISQLLGSTATSVLHGAYCDILTVYHSEESEG